MLHAVSKDCKAGELRLAAAAETVTVTPAMVMVMVALQGGSSSRRILVAAGAQWHYTVLGEHLVGCSAPDCCSGTSNSVGSVFGFGRALP